MEEQARDTIRFRSPAAWPGDLWREDLPSGNGLLGAVVKDRTYKLRFPAGEGYGKGG